MYVNLMSVIYIYMLAGKKLACIVDLDEAATMCRLVYICTVSRFHFDNE